MAHICARYYDPSIGRFISEDPIGFKGSGTNFYAYVNNDPIDLSDPFGLCPKKDCLLNALKKNGVALGLDALGVGAGFLPGGDFVVAGLGVAATVNSATSANTTTTEGQVATTGAIGSIFGSQLSVMKALKVGGKAVPFLATALSVAGVGADVWQTNEDYNKCMAGTQ